MSRNQELRALKAQAQAIKDQLRSVSARIRHLQGRRHSAMVAFVDSYKCAGCGLCQQVCPTFAISIDRVATVNAQRCVGCGRCVAACPRGAISLQQVLGHVGSTSIADNERES